MAKKEGAAAVGIHTGTDAVSYEPTLAADNKTPTKGADQGAWDHAGYQSKYIVTVGQENAQYTSVNDAFDAILLGTHGNVPDIDNRYLIKIGPGDFPITSTVTYYGYISLLGAGVGETLLWGDEVSCLIRHRKGEVDLDGLTIENRGTGYVIQLSDGYAIDTVLRLGTHRLTAMKSADKDIRSVSNDLSTEIRVIMGEVLSLDNAADETYNYYPYPTIVNTGIYPPIISRIPDALIRRQNTRRRQSVVGISPAAFHRNCDVSNWSVNASYCYGVNMPFQWYTTGADPGVDPLSDVSEHLLVCDLAQFIPYGAGLESVLLKFVAAAGGEKFCAFIVGTRAAEDDLAGLNGWLNASAAAPTVEVLATTLITAGAAGVQMMELTPAVRPRTFEQLTYTPGGGVAYPMSFRHPAVRENLFEKIFAINGPYKTSEFFGAKITPADEYFMSDYASVMLVVHCDSINCAFDGAVATFSSTLPDNLYIAGNPL